MVDPSSPALLELEIRAPAKKQKLAWLVLPPLVVFVVAVWAVTLAFVEPGMVFVPLGSLALTALAAGYAPYSWLRGRTHVRVDSTVINARYEHKLAFHETNTFLDTVRELRGRRAPKWEPLFGRYEVVALRTDMDGPWEVVGGLESLEQANDIAQQIQQKLGLTATTSPMLVGGNLLRSLGSSLIQLTGAGLLVTIGSAIIFALASTSGVEVARVDLLAGAPLSLELASGDRLRFYTDVEMEEIPLKGMESRLADTKLRLRLVVSGSRVTEQECSLYAGVAEHKYGGLSNAEIVGMKNDCRFLVEGTGPHTLEATVAWSQKPRRAVLRVHKE